MGVKKGLAKGGCWREPGNGVLQKKQHELQGTPVPKERGVSYTFTHR